MCVGRGGIFTLLSYPLGLLSRFRERIFRRDRIAQNAHLRINCTYRWGGGVLSGKLLAGFELPKLITCIPSKPLIKFIFKIKLKF